MRIAALAIAALCLATCAKEAGPTIGEATLEICPASDACRSFAAPLAEGGTVMDLLAAAEDAGRISVDSKGAGETAYVEKIDGVGPQDGKYWLYWVDGAFQCVGAGARTVEPGAVVSWRLTDEDGDCG